MADPEYVACACAGKESYDSRGHAAKVVRSMRRFGKTVEPYKCSACQRWHVGRPAGVPKNR